MKENYGLRLEIHLKNQLWKVITAFSKHLGLLDVHIYKAIDEPAKSSFSGGKGLLFYDLDVPYLRVLH